jgi:LysR family hydrogen peroxide-inducible transcriptional activator
MDLRQLAAVTAVADTGTFSAAADVLHTVQSNVSTHIARLERELGVTLVDRAAGRLTEEGEVVVARARRIAGELDALVADVASLRSDVTGGVHATRGFGSPCSRATRPACSRRSSRGGSTSPS